MLRIVAEAYNEAIFTEAIHLFGLTKDQLTLIDSNTDIVYEFNLRDRAYILKLIHISQSTHNYVRGEVDWVNYLARHEIPVSSPVPSKNGNLVEVVEAESSYFTVVAYEKARGKHLGYEEDQTNSQLFQTCGWVVGRMHALAKGYTPSNPAYKRREWHEGVNREGSSPDLAIVYAIQNRLIEHLHTLPQDRDSYGLIHGDFHSYNFNVHDQGITVFDFTECNYSWFVYELGIVLYHVLDLPYLGGNYEGFGWFFMKHFMPAYNRENRLDPFWVGEMDTFLKLREITTYNYIYTNWDYQNYPGVRAWMEACRYRIEHDIPIVSLRYNFS